MPSSGVIEPRKYEKVSDAELLCSVSARNSKFDDDISINSQIPARAIEL